MDPRTFSFAAALVSAAIAGLIIKYASFRQDRGLLIIASGYAAVVLGFLLLLGQGVLPRQLCFVLANLLIVFSQLSLAWGLRCRFGLSPGWPRRFWLYLSAWLAILVALSLGFDSFTARAILASAFLIAGAVEFLVALYRAPNAQPAAIKSYSLAISLSFAGLHAIRIALLLAPSTERIVLMDAAFVNSYTFSFSLVYSVLWAGLILIIDASDILTQLGHKTEVFESLAVTDELTGLNNRHSLDGRTAAEMERAVRYRTPLSIIMLDVDHFKRVNDTWGHDTGDEVLKRIAAIVGDSVREPDSVYRWGGEELMVLAPHTPLVGAASLAEKLRKAIAAESFPRAGTVTASFGVAEFQPGEGAERWFKRVDQALYRAKNSGRDRVVAFGPGDELPVARVNIAWRQEWESGDALIDAGHQRLVERANDLLDVSLSAGSRERLIEGLDALLDEVSAHFSEEEAVLARIAYPGLEDHASLHRDLMVAASELRAKAMAEGVEPGALLDFLVERVVLDHLVNADSSFFGFTRGLEPRTGD